MQELKRNKKILDVKNLKIYFNTNRGKAKAVSGNNLRMYANEVLAIVGESGCGKSVTAMSILGLLDEVAKIEDDSSIQYFNEKNECIELANADENTLREVRGKEISMIFQEPMTSLNPVLTIGDQISEAILVHQKMSKNDVQQRVVELLTMVGISEPSKVVNYYPHQLSGGMRQRVMIAIALSCDPKLLIADEPTTALDVTIQAQILKLMSNLKDELGTSIMLITHDLGVVAQMADHVNVMYAGKVVETAPVTELFKNPKHPYTIGLMDSMPSLNNGGKLKVIEGSVPDSTEKHEGCLFAPRCPRATAVCFKKEPQDYKVKSRHHVFCHLYDGMEG